MKKVSIIGFGRFGKILFKLLNEDFELLLNDQNEKSFLNFELGKNAKICMDYDELFSSEIIFIALPIPLLEDFMKHNMPEFNDDHLIIDVLSVKLHPKQVFEKELGNLKTRVLLTHPMFGPDSSANGFDNLPIVLDQNTATDEEYVFWKDFFLTKSLRVVEMTADQHDRLAANSQGVTHLLGRMLGEFELEKTPIDTAGAKTLHQLMDVTLNDSWELFEGLQNYNPYAKAMRSRIKKALEEIDLKLKPKPV